MSSLISAQLNISYKIRATDTEWHAANRKQAGIAKNLVDGKDISEVYGLGEAGLFDEFFCFLDHLGFKDLFIGLEPKSKNGVSRVLFRVIIFIYLMRIVWPKILLAH